MQRLMGAFGDGVVLALPVLVVVGLATLVGVVRRRNEGRRSLRALGAGILVAALVLVAATTLLPVAAGSPASVNMTPGETIRNYLSFGDDLLSARNLGLNVALFVPIGFGLSLWRRWGVARVILCGLLLSAAVEMAQYVLPLGRAVDVDDVVLNSVGAALGGLAMAVVRRLAPVRSGHDAPKTRVSA